MWKNKHLLLLMIVSFSVFTMMMVMPSTVFSVAISERAYNFSEENVKKGELIFIGTVINKEYIAGKPRPNVRTINIFTDLTFKVDLLVKGVPNIDKNTVKFRIDGGRIKHPLTGEEIIESSDAVDIVYQLEKDDKALLILRKNPAIAKWIPGYEGLFPVGPIYGNFLVRQDPNTKGEKVVFFQFGDKKRNGLELPVPLVLDMIRSAENHPAEVNQLVKDIERMYSQKISSEVIVNHISNVLKNL